MGIAITVATILLGWLIWPSSRKSVLNLGGALLLGLISIVLFLAIPAAYIALIVLHPFR